MNYFLIVISLKFMGERVVKLDRLVCICSGVEICAWEREPESSTLIALCCASFADLMSEAEVAARIRTIVEFVGQPAGAAMPPNAAFFTSGYAPLTPAELGQRASQFQTIRACIMGDGIRYDVPLATPVAAATIAFLGF